MTRLTARQVDVLVRHAIGAQPFVAPQGAENAVEIANVHRSVRALLLRGFLKGDSPRPRFTYLTRPGREIVTRALAEMADTLARAGYHVEAPGNGSLTGICHPVPVETTTETKRCAEPCYADAPGQVR